MQAVDGPVLELSDIMHPMSPSPAPQLPPPAESAGLPNVDISSNYTAFHRQADSSVVQFGGDSVLRMQSPEPLDDSEVEAMRSRLHQLGLADPGGTPSSATLTEKELAEMVRPHISCAALIVILAWHTVDPTSTIPPYPSAFTVTISVASRDYCSSHSTTQSSSSGERGSTRSLGGRPRRMGEKR